MSDSLAVPWVQIAGIATGAAGVAVATTRFLVKELFSSRLTSAENERDRAIAECAAVKKERDEYKESWKASVQSHRVTRLEVEALEGTPSIVPPPMHGVHEDTGTYQINDAADKAWRDNRDQQLAQKRQDRQLERYNKGLPIDTPVPHRPKQKSRHDR